MRLRLVPSATALALLVAPASAYADFAHTVLPGESLSSIAATDGLSVAQLAAANGLAQDAQLIAGSTVMIPSQDASAAAASSATPVSSSGTSTAATGDGDADSDDATTAPAATGDGDADSDDGATASAGGSAPAVWASYTGTMTWFGGPDDPTAGGPPASCLGYRSDGMAFDNSGSLGGHWLMHFPRGQTMSMTQIDLGPAAWTGNVFDMAYSALPNTPYTEQTWPNPTVTGTYQGP